MAFALAAEEPFDADCTSLSHGGAHFVSFVAALLGLWGIVKIVPATTFSSGWKMFRVLTVTTDQHRMQLMMEALRKLHVPNSMGAPLFLFAIRDELKAAAAAETLR